MIDAALAAVPTIVLADHLCGPGQMRRIGDRWTARCPLPGHDERTPSFTVYPGDRGWWCFGCNRGGDVVNLAVLAWEIDRADVAAAEVLMTFGNEVPQRPPSWFANQERQAPYRDALGEIRTRHIQRRLFRWIFEPLLSLIEDPDERAREAEYVWAELMPLAVRMAGDRGPR